MHCLLHRLKIRLITVLWWLRTDTLRYLTVTYQQTTTVFLLRLARSYLRRFTTSASNNEVDLLFFAGHQISPTYSDFSAHNNFLFLVHHPALLTPVPNPLYLRWATFSTENATSSNVLLLLPSKWYSRGPETSYVHS